MNEAVDDFIFNLKFQSKQFRRESDRQLREAKKYETKCRDNLRKGNRDAAQIYAQQVIAQRGYSARYLQMAVKFDIMAGTLRTQQVNKRVCSDIAKLNKTVMQEMSPEQIVDSAKTMTQFNNLCEQMGVQQQVVQNMMGQTESPQSVQELIGQIETEIAVDTAGQIKDAPAVQEQQQVQVEDQDKELEQMKAMLAMK